MNRETFNILDSMLSKIRCIDTQVLDLILDYHMQLIKEQVIRELLNYLQRRRFYHDIVETCIWERPNRPVLVYTRVTYAEEQRRLHNNRRMSRHDD